MKEWFEFGWNFERYLSLLQIITGWIILAYLVFHVIYVNRLAHGVTINDSFLMPLLVIFGVVLTFHISNGIRILLIEYGYLTPKGHINENWLRYKKHRNYEMIMMIILAISLIISFWVIYK
ncbi:hypothetical protein [Stygiolobus azoricus]|uniref:Succinate dehydrogenase n=1 Tax=Stygiolobus azoricus TaxID=41675 RepID=A0A650CPN1_9CREN|nr:hypothetical protein [Stygiolobus azoricus]QGR19804.1 hypothetical protein D1868_07315 [Stygiolobus azoricus]